MDTTLNNRLMVYLYKYRPLNYHTIQIIIQNKIYFSAPITFNDPLDCKINFSVDYTRKQLEEEIANTEKFIKGVNSDAPETEGVHVKISPETERYEKLTLENRLSFYKSLLNTDFIDSKEKAAKFIEKLQNRIRTKFGVCCFSKINNDVLMFSHYSNGHKGICLQFSSNSDPTFFHTYDIKYSMHNPQIDLGNINMKTFAVQALTKKSNKWEYEYEVRIIKDEPGIYNFSEEALTGIIFGAQTLKDDIDIMEKILNIRSHPITLYKASFKNDSYQLKIEKIKTVS